MKNIYILILLCVFVLSSCKNDQEVSPLDLFSNEINLSASEYDIDVDLLARIEGIQCNDSSLIVFDYHSSKSFSLFNLRTGKYLGRFGEIGQGPNEIPLGCYGNLESNEFNIFYDPQGLVARYNLDSLISNIDFNHTILGRYKISEASFSQIIPTNDTVFLGAGVYKSEFQYVLFNKTSEIIDYKIEIFNANDETFNADHKYLSNQGVLRKHPSKNKFVYSINNSSDIDFIEVFENKINLIKSIRLGDPKCQPIQDGFFNRVMPNPNNTIGYIDVSTTNKYVYALYTDKKFSNKNGGGNPRSSNIVLVFDWAGNPIKMYKANNEIYYITVNEQLNKMYAAIINTDDGWSVVSYNLDE